MFEVRLADDASLPVRRAKDMGRSETIQTQNPFAGPGEMASARATHRAQPEDDHIKNSFHENRVSEKETKPHYKDWSFYTPDRVAKTTNFARVRLWQLYPFR